MTTLRSFPTAFTPVTRAAAAPSLHAPKNVFRLTEAAFARAESRVLRALYRLQRAGQRPCRDTLALSMGLPDASVLEPVLARLGRSALLRDEPSTLAPVLALTLTGLAVAEALCRPALVRGKAVA